jgi:ADP-heptose:LPS heptosyltransferase
MSIPDGSKEGAPFPAIARGANPRAAASHPRDILVIKPSSLGDVVHALPAVALVKKRWPKARLRWLINPEWAPLLEGNPHVDEAVLFPRGEFRGLAGAAKIPAWAKAMRREQRADLTLDFQGLLRSALIARLCCRGEIVGLSDAREGARFLYHRAANVRRIAHAVDRYLALVECLGIEISRPLEWPLPEGESPEGFSLEEPFILLHPFSRGAGKSLSVDEVTEFCRAVAPMPVALAGRASDTVPQLGNVTDLLNRTSLAELIWLLRRAAFVVSVDSGPMHIAAALTPRLISLHTWSDPGKVGPYRPEAWVWKDGALFQMRDLGNPKARLPAGTMTEVGRFVRESV